MTALPECMPSTAELAAQGAVLALQGARFAIDEATGRLALASLLPHQRENIVLAWVGTWSAEWARLRFPCITPPLADCEALIGEPVYGVDVRAPWPFFLLELPSGLVQIRNGQGVFESIDRMLCMHFAERWGYTALAQSCEMRHWQQTTAQMVRGEPGRDHADPRIVELPWDDDDVNAHALMSRLLINASLMLTCEHKHLVESPEGGRVCGHCGKSRWDGEPLFPDVVHPVRNLKAEGDKR